MGGLFGGGKSQTPYIPPAVPIPAVPTTADASVQLSGQRTRQQAIGGLASTIATSPQGVLGGGTASGGGASKSLLGN